jgi:hypothetical protein
MLRKKSTIFAYANINSRVGSPSPSLPPPPPLSLIQQLEYRCFADEFLQFRLSLSRHKLKEFDGMVWYGYNYAIMPCFCYFCHTLLLRVILLCSTILIRFAYRFLIFFFSKFIMFFTFQNCGIYREEAVLYNTCLRRSLIWLLWTISSIVIYPEPHIKL